MRGSRLSDCEIMIMQCVWGVEHDISSLEIQKAMIEKFDKKYERTTIATFLKKLKDKKFIMSYQKGVVVYYRALVKEVDFQREEAQLFKRNIFGGSFSKLLSAFDGNEKLTEQEIEKIRDLIDGTTRDN